MPNVLSAVLRSIISQVVGIAAMMALLNIIGGHVSGTTIAMTGILSASLVAAAMAWLCRLSPIWIGVNAALPAAIAACLFAEIPPLIFPVVGIVILALYLPAIFAQVPFFPTSSAVVNELLKILPTDRPFRFIDLGCGFGHALFPLAAARPEGSFRGIDLSPLAIALASIRALRYPNLSFRLANIWSYPIAEYDYIYLFLAPPPMARIGEKAAGEMSPSALLISNSFAIPGWNGETVSINDDRQHTLHIYRRPSR